jgi:hypothetical protein
MNNVEFSQLLGATASQPSQANAAILQQTWSRALLYEPAMKREHG